MDTYKECVAKAVHGCRECPLNERCSLSDKRANVKIEGGPHNWWYVCEECHTAVSMRDKTCPECGAELDWSTAVLEWSDKK